MIRVSFFNAVDFFSVYHKLYWYLLLRCYFQPTKVFLEMTIKRCKYCGFVCSAWNALEVIIALTMPISSRFDLDSQFTAVNCGFYCKCIIPGQKSQQQKVHFLGVCKHFFWSKTSFNGMVKQMRRQAHSFQLSMEIWNYCAIKACHTFLMGISSKYQLNPFSKIRPNWKTMCHNKQFILSNSIRIMYGVVLMPVINF